MDKCSSLNLISDSRFHSMLQVFYIFQGFLWLLSMTFQTRYLVVYACISVHFSAIFAKTNRYFDKCLCCLWSVCVYHSWFLLLYLYFYSYLFLLVSTAIYCNSLSSRDYLDKREELRQAREERFVCHPSILPYPSLWLFALSIFTVELLCVCIFNSACTKHFYSKRLL